jgi:radical SAM/Cys-rich protein
VEALKLLNEAGYGVSNSLKLDLVFNPEGAFLPSDQSELEAAYHEKLESGYGITFHDLITIANMPIGRFRSQLLAENGYGDYLALLKRSFNSDTLDGLMCRHQLSVGWDGTIYDCDFNLALGIPIDMDFRRIGDVDLSKLGGRRIATGEHCFGCTAGQGSSCGGALITT